MHKSACRLLDAYRKEYVQHLRTGRSVNAAGPSRADAAAAREPSIDLFSLQTPDDNDADDNNMNEAVLAPAAAKRSCDAPQGTRSQVAKRARGSAVPDLLPVAMVPPGLALSVSPQLLTLQAHASSSQWQAATGASMHALATQVHASSSQL